MNYSLTTSACTNNIPRNCIYSPSGKCWSKGWQDCIKPCEGFIADVAS